MLRQDLKRFCNAWFVGAYLPPGPWVSGHQIRPSRLGLADRRCACGRLPHRPDTIAGHSLLDYRVAGDCDNREPNRRGGAAAGGKCSVPDFVRPLSVPVTDGTGPEPLMMTRVSPLPLGCCRRPTGLLCSKIWSFFLLKALTDFFIVEKKVN